MMADESEFYTHRDSKIKLTGQPGSSDPPAITAEESSYGDNECMGETMQNPQLRVDDLMTIGNGRPSGNNHFFRSMVQPSEPSDGFEDMDDLMTTVRTN